MFLRHNVVWVSYSDGYATFCRLSTAHDLIVLGAPRLRDALHHTGADALRLVARAAPAYTREGT